MHAFLIIGNNDGGVEKEIEKLSKSLGAKIMPYEISKIEDIRELNKFLRLSIADKTLITIKNIHEVTPEAVNAFLKNLEEPQENLFFVLTAPMIQKVLPTITSRCQIIKVSNTHSPIYNESEIKEFLNANTNQKLLIFDKMKERSDAISFIENLIYYLHDKRELNSMEILSKTLTRLKANGNLQLANLAINFNQ